jgi:hypothetical protein
VFKPHMARFRAVLRNALMRVSVNWFIKYQDWSVDASSQMINSKLSKVCPRTLSIAFLNILAVIK